ncbi:MAG: hypothetical protein QHH19_05210 [Candidatus Thermoplasmatota archaeon]|jgi:hypothetical protein|nr:hypothetical protein [Candidatus Thermoplasmatota archaeon]
MGRTRQASFENSEVISASEIGQYHYCSIAWYLQKCGYEPVSALLNTGVEKHAQLGEVLDNAQTGVRRSMFLAITGLLMVIVSISMILFEVIF